MISSQLHRRIVKAIPAVFILTCVLSVGAQPLGNRPDLLQSPKTPNIVLIVADDLGYGDLGCYGQVKIKTPNLDALASTGTRFTSFYAGSSVCAPSRCVLMTGRHTGHATVRGNVEGAALAPVDVTIAQLLLANGYRTGAIGKWALGDVGSTSLPGEKGFLDFVGYLNQTRAHDYYAPYVDRYDTNGGLRRVEFPQNENGGRGIYFPDLFTKASTNFIRINKPEWYSGQRPFFLYFAPTLPHANNGLGRETGNGMQVPDDQPYSNETWLPPERNKAAMITRLDKSVGELMATLKAYKQETNTLILFTSDNGPHKEGGVDPEFFRSSGPLRGIKRDLYEGGIRVPMIAAWPGKIPAGKVSDEPWAFWDLLPTLAEIGGARTLKDIDGISYAPTLLGQTQTNRHEYLYWEFHEKGFKQAIRMGQWKAVRIQSDAALELYDLSKDIGEKNNVAHDNPKLVLQLENLLKSARTDSPAYPIADTSSKAPEQP
jgi:arylsulfatase A-like enzyme